MKKLSHVNEIDETIFGVGERFREEREKLSFTQKQLAGKLVTTSRTIISYENNESPPKLSKLTLFHGLGADIGYILTGVKTVGEITQEEAALLDSFRAMCPEQQQTFKTVGTALAQPASKKSDVA